MGPAGASKINNGVVELSTCPVSPSAFRPPCPEIDLASFNVRRKLFNV